MKQSTVFLTVLFSVFSLLFQFCTTETGSNQNKENNRENLLDSLLNEAIINNEIPGAVACIVSKGETVYHKAFGWQNMKDRLGMDENTIFRMASMTKGLTAVGIMMLYERGLIELDEPIGKYLPGFEKPEILTEVLSDSTYLVKPARNQITIRQLLTHTSGIGYGFQNADYNALVIKNNVSDGFGTDDRTLLENVRRIADLPLLHEPGEKYTYGMSYDVLGGLIEVVSGMRYDKFIRQYLLEPLQMNDSFFIIPEKEQYRLANVYQPGSNNVGLASSGYKYVNYPLIQVRRAFSGGADLCSTAADYSNFLQMILNKGIFRGNRIIGERYINMMLAKQTGLHAGGYEQGFAARVTNAEGAAQGHMDVGSFYFGGFFDTYSWVDPKKEYVAVLLLQMYPGNHHNIHSKFQRITYGVIDELGN